MDVHRIAPGLWRWTAYHEEWRKDVGCVYLETDDATVLFDPLVPPEDSERFLEYLDADVERAASPVHIVLTIYWHVRSSAELAKRYGAEVWAPARSAKPVERRTSAAPRPAAPRRHAPGRRHRPRVGPCRGARVRPPPSPRARRWRRAARAALFASARHAGWGRAVRAPCGKRCGRCSTSRSTACSYLTVSLCSAPGTPRWPPRSASRCPGLL